MRWFITGESLHPQVDRTMQRNEHMLSYLKYHLTIAQHHMKQMAVRGRIDKEFAIGN